VDERGARGTGSLEGNSPGGGNDVVRERGAIGKKKRRKEAGSFGDRSEMKRRKTQQSGNYGKEGENSSNYMGETKRKGEVPELRGSSGERISIYHLRGGKLTCLGIHERNPSHLCGFLKKRMSAEG